MLRSGYNVDFGYISLFEVTGNVAAYAAVTLAKQRLRAP